MKYAFVAMSAAAMVLTAAAAFAQTTQETFPPAPLVPLESQPAARLVVDAPLPAQLAKGLVVIRYRAENLRIVPVYGPAALDVSPRLGHIHVTVDDAPWHWADASGNPVIINGLSPGRHKILIQLANATHQPIDQGTVEVTMPAAKPQPEAHQR